MQVIDLSRKAVRGIMRRIAKILNRLSGGRLRPDTATLIGFAAHVPIAILIATEHNVWAAILLIIFGLFDTLDGELSRLQKRSSARGMLLDASTDRMKEVLLYTGAAYALIQGNHPAMAVWAVAACGASLCVSYIKAKGEAAVASSGKHMTHQQLNRLFGGGLMSFEVRMFILFIGLLIGQLGVAVIIIAITAGYTALWRLIHISKQLRT